MAAPTIYPSIKQFVGVAKESTPGTAVASAFTLLCSKFDAEDKVTYLEDSGMRGSMTHDYGRVQGTEHTEFDAEGLAHMDGVGFLLANIFGADAVTGTTAPYTHAFTLLNSGTGQPLTHTFTDWQGPTASVSARVYPGACLSELTFKWSAESELITWSAKGMAWPSAAASGTPTSSPTTVTPIPGWQMKTGLAGPASGGTVSSIVTEGEVTFTRDLQLLYTGNASQSPYAIQRGGLSVAGKLSFISTDETQLNYMLNNTQPQVQLLASQGSSATLVQLQVDMQTAAFTVAKINRGNEAVQYDAEYTAVANSTNAGASGGLSPASVTIKNAQASGTFL